MSSVDQKFVVIKDPDPRADHKWLIVPVVNPQGTIKYVRVSPLIGAAATHIVQVSPNYDGTLEVGFRPGLERMGWVFLADAIHDHFGPKWRKIWAAYQKWMLDGPMCSQGGQVKPFPAKYLPPCIEQRRRKAAAEAEVVSEVVIPGLDDDSADDDDELSEL